MKMKVISRDLFARWILNVINQVAIPGDSFPCLPLAGLEKKNANINCSHTFLCYSVYVWSLHEKDKSPKLAWLFKAQLPK